VAETNAKVEAAVKRLLNRLYKTPYTVAIVLRLNRATLSYQLAEGNSRPEGKENKQNLMYIKEKALAQWITQLIVTIHPIYHPFICEIAEEIRKQHHLSLTISYPALGNLWVLQFLNCHPTLPTTISHLIKSI
jgi:Tc5 transposase DNA-binding domain